MPKLAAVPPQEILETLVQAEGGALPQNGREDDRVKIAPTHVEPAVPSTSQPALPSGVGIVSEMASDKEFPQGFPQESPPGNPQETPKEFPKGIPKEFPSSIPVQDKADPKPTTVMPKEAVYVSLEGERDNGTVPEGFDIKQTPVENDSRLDLFALDKNRIFQADSLPTSASSLTEAASFHKPSHDERQILVQISEKLIQVHSKKLDSITLQLEPETLGALQIKISIRPDGVWADILTPHASVREMLERNQGLLRETLAEQGLQIGRFSVNVGDPESQFKSHQNNPWEREGSLTSYDRPSAFRQPDLQEMGHGTILTKDALNTVNLYV